MEWLTNPDIWIALITLTALEIVLGVDNIIFISILVAKLPAAQQPRARYIGLSLAMIMRILLLDIVFSLDSVITAVGLVVEVPVMVAAVVIAVGVMMLSAGPINDF